MTGAHTPYAAGVACAAGEPLAARYDPDVSPFSAVGEPADPAGWTALAGLVAGGDTVVVFVPSDVAEAEPWTPAGWVAGFDLRGVQMTGEAMDPGPSDGLEVLGHADVAEMLDLVERTRPGPFEKRTVELGGYLGVREGGRLVAMAGHRCRPPGHTEISAVCTDADQRGRGLAARLVRATAAPILARGEVPFLHTGLANSSAIRVYERLGMRPSREGRFVGLRRA